MEKTEAARTARARKRRVHLARAVVLSALMVLVVLMIVLVMVPYLAGITTFSPLVRKTGELGRLALLISVAALLYLVFAALYIPGFVRDRSCFRTLTARSRDYEMGRLATFMNALDGARIKAGVPEPRVAVLDNAQPNALSFLGGRSPLIGVTLGLISADLSYKEIEGVMAHQLACLTAGDCLARPGFKSFEFLAYAGLGGFSIVALASTAMVGAGRGLGAGIAFLITAAVILFLLGFSIRRLRSNREYDHLLADSLAAAITGNPEELASAIRKVDSLVNGKEKGRFPDNELGYKFWFVPAYRWSESPEQFVERRHKALRMNAGDASVARQVDGVRESMEELAVWAESLMKDRLANLD